MTACGTLSYILTYDEVLAFSVLKTVGTVRYHVARKICIHQSFSALTLWLGGEHPGIPACKKTRFNTTYYQQGNWPYQVHLEYGH